MAEKGVQLDQEFLSCSICLDLLVDPVTIPCGHSYCEKCIETHWSKEEEKKKSCSCPQCRHTFTRRPHLVKSTVLAALAEQLKKTSLHDAPADLCYAGPEDVACDVCSGRKQKALMSCLSCLVSYCETHLQPHHESPAFKKHELVEPCKKLQEMLCPRHNEVMKMFCRTDQQLICYLCSVDEHKGHDTVSAAAERKKKQKELGKHQKNLQQRIQDRDKDLKLLQQELEAINRSADEAVEDRENIFNQLICFMQQRIFEVIQKLRDQAETEVNRIEELEEKLEQEIVELKRRAAELKKLSLTEDPNQFIRSFSSLPALTESTNSSSNPSHSVKCFEDMTKSLSELKNKLQDVLKNEQTVLTRGVTEVDVSPPQPEPTTRAEFLRISCDLTLDENTLPEWMVLSLGNRRVTNVSERAGDGYPYHPDRFKHHSQVMSKQRLPGRCYFEVDYEKGGDMLVGVTYKSISRAVMSDVVTFGLNDKSWALLFEASNTTFIHDSDSTPVPHNWSSRVGVYVDQKKGVLSFYNVAETMTLLHRVQTTFTEPLYLGLGVYEGAASGRTAELK